MGEEPYSKSRYRDTTVPTAIYIQFENDKNDDNLDDAFFTRLPQNQILESNQN